jgi:uncharacterized protein YjiS (DUF1127 family)
MEKAMSYMNYTHSNNHHLATRLAILGHPLSVVRVIASRIRNRRELNTLLGLSDYQLRDIGVERADLQREAIKPFWRA